MSGAVNVNAGALTVSGTGTLVGNNPLKVNAGSATFSSSGASAVGAISNSGSLNVSGGSLASNRPSRTKARSPSAEAHSMAERF